jgi:hypothetical protein
MSSKKIPRYWRDSLTGRPMRQRMGLVLREDANLEIYFNRHGALPETKMAESWRAESWTDFLRIGEELEDWGELVRENW